MRYSSRFFSLPVDTDSTSPCTVLVLMRTCYWAYEIYHEVTPTRIDKRLKMFPYHYESTLHERDVFEAIQRGESAESCGSSVSPLPPRPS